METENRLLCVACFLATSRLVGVSPTMGQTPQVVPVDIQGCVHDICTAAAWGPVTGRTIYVRNDAELVVQDVGEEPGRVFKHFTNAQGVTDLEFFPDCQRVVIVMENGDVELWDTRTLGPIVFEGGQGGNHNKLIVDGPGVFDIYFLQNKPALFIMDREGTMTIWRTEEWRLLCTLRSSAQEQVNEFTVTSDGTRLAIARDDGIVELWHRKDSDQDEGCGWSRRHVLSGHRGRVEIDFAPTEDLLAAGDEAGVVRLWNTVTGSLVGEPYQAHDGQIVDVKFKPPGVPLILASIGMDQMVVMENITEYLKGSAGTRRAP